MPLCSEHSNNWQFYPILLRVSLFHFNVCIHYYRFACFFVHMNLICPNKVLKLYACDVDATLSTHAHTHASVLTHTQSQRNKHACTHTRTHLSELLTNQNLFYVHKPQIYIHTVLRYTQHCVNELLYDHFHTEAKATTKTVHNFF